MCTASCHSTSDTPSGCQQRCSPASGDKKIGNAVVWIVATDARTVHLFVQRPGQPIEPMSMGCCCSKQAIIPEELAKYLDTALACGHYDGLVLVGSTEALKAIKRLLSPAVHNRVIAEIPDDIAGKNARQVAQSIAARIAS